PQQTRRLLANYKLSGQLSLSGTIVGVDDETTNPHIELAFRAKETEVKHRQSGNSVQHLQLSGHLTNGKRNSLETAELSIDSLWANFAGRPIFAQLRLSSLLDPFLEGRATATLEFGKVLSFLGQDTVMQGSGLLRIDLDLAGPLHHVGRPDELHAVHYRGGISLEDVALSLRHQPLELRHAYGRLALRGRALHTPSLTAQLNGQPLRLAATLHDFLSYAYGEERVLKLDANLQLDTLYIPALLSHTAQLGRQRGLAATQPFHPSALGMELPGWLAASLHLDARVIYLNQYAYQGVRGTLSLRDKVLSMQAFEIGGKKGRALLFGSLNSQQRAQNTFQLALDLNSEDLPLVLQDLGLWPARRPVPTSAVQVGGNLRLNGYATRSAQPRIQLHLALENGYFFQPVQRIFIRDVTLSALFTEQHLKDPRHTPIRIDTLYGVANQFPFWASLRLDDPATGQVRMRLRTEIGADVLLNYFSLPTVAQPQGTLAFWVELAGKLSDISDPKKLVKMPQRGDFRMQNVSFDLAPAGLPFRQLNAEMYYDGKGVEIRQMSGRMNGNSFRVRGTVYDILGFLYTDQPGLAAKFSFESDSLNLETFALLDRPRGDTAKLKQIDLPSQSEIVAHFSLGYAYYQRLQMRDMEMDVVLQGHLLQVRQARLRTCGGLLAARGQMDQTDPQQPVIYTHLELDQVDLHQVFASFDALGKQQLDSLGIQGRLSLAGDLHLHLQPRSSRVSLPKLANFSIRLDEGSIRNLGQFLKPNPLLNQQDLATPTYFSLRLDNVFLADSTLFMPSVEFISNKLNFTARGHYRLNDQLRYDLAVLLPKEEELAAADYYHTPKYYGKTVYVFRLTENPERDKGMRVKFLPLWALRNILRARPRSAADA
ncbi:MAG: AsmA-like C-terminal region-containing protein, partial [Sphingobacteriia bacterium]